MSKTRKKRRENQPGPEPKPVYGALLGDPLAIISGVFAALFSATVFISGESITKSGSGAVLPVLWFLLATCGLFFFVRKYDRECRFDRMDIIWIAILGTFLASMAYHFLPGKGCIRYGINLGTAWLGCAAAWPLIRTIFENPQRRKAIMLVLLAVSCSLSVYGSFRHFYETPRMLKAFEEDPEAVFAAAGITEGPGSAQRELFANRLKTSTPLATYVLSNTLAGLLAPVGILALGLMLTSSRSKFDRVVFGVLAAVILFTLVLTHSRSGCIAVVCGLPILAIIRFGGTVEIRTKLRLHLPLVGVCSAVVLILCVFLAFQGGFLDTAKRSLGFRFEYWRASLGMIRDNPVLGCGPGNFQQYYTQYKSPVSSEEILDPHNFLVELGAIAGIPCALLFIALLVFLAMKLFKNDQADEPPQIVSSSKDIPKSGFEPGTIAIMFGGLIGLLLGFLITQFDEISIKSEGFLICFTCSLISVGLLIPWLRSEATVSPRVIGAAGFALLVNLLAAGGITYPNLVIVFWLFSACIAGKPAPMKTATETEDVAVSSKNAGFVTTLVLIAVFGLAAVLAYFYAYRPILDSKDALSRAQSERYAEDYIKRLHEASRADPLSPEIRYSLFEAYMNYWDVNSPPREKMLTAALDAESEAARLSPKSATLRYGIARDLFIRFESGRNAKGNEKLLDLAVKRLGEAVELYPNHALSRAAYAIALSAAGKTEEAAEQEIIALELDAEMPHREQKLDENILSRLRDL